MIECDVHFERGEFALRVDARIGQRVTGLFGPSGAGKSTLIQLIAGLERPDRGRIALDGRPLFDADRGINVPPQHREVGVVFQEPRLFPHFSVERNLIFGRPRGRHSEAKHECRRIVDMLELGQLLHRRPLQLSGGERQRVALGRALICRPKCLLFDEPLVALDRRLKQQIIPYLQRVRDEWSVPMVYVSHDLGELLQLTRSLIVIDRGMIVSQGDYGDLAHQTTAVDLMHDQGMQNLVTARVLRHVEGDGVSVLQLGTGANSSQELVIPACASSPGSFVTVSVTPWDIALATEVVSAVSIQNQLRGVVVRCTHHERSAIVEVDIGLPITVEISRRSVAALQIAPGRPIVCLIKSHAIRIVATERTRRR